MPLLLFVLFAFFAAIFSAIAGLVLGAMATVFRPYYSDSWGEMVMEALFMWAFSAALAGYALGGVLEALRLRQSPVMRVILLISSIGVWIFTTYQMGNDEYVSSVVMLMVYSIIPALIGAYWGGENA